MNTIIPFISRSDPAERAAWIAALERAMPTQSIRDFATLSKAEREQAMVAIVANPDPAELAQFLNLVWVQSLWAGVERIVQELPGTQLKIVRMVDPQLADTMAEAVLAWTLYLHRDMPRYRAQQARGEWLAQPLPLPRERRVSILGLGNLGILAAQRLMTHGFTLAGWSRSKYVVEGMDTYAGAVGLQDMLAQTDILIALLPLTPQTRGLLDGAALAAMPRGASIINFARGPILVEDALISALDSGHIDHAVLDVFDREPLPPGHAYWKHPSVTVLPHISAPTNQTTASAIVAAHMAAYFQSGVIPPSVDLTRGY
jgi:glyoxylate/hydroxypyruvate reductase